MLFVFIFINGSCKNQNAEKNDLIKEDVSKEIVIEEIIKTKTDSINDLFFSHPEYLTDGFDFPVGKPNAKAYYNAQAFGVNTHLGDDWNAVTGGNSDLGAPIYSIANGYVNFAVDLQGGWGKVIRIWHKINDTTIVESLYAHCDTMLVAKGQFVEKGENIGTIGNAGGVYLAHLHFEIRDNIYLPIGGGYDPITDGYLDPTLYIKSHRK